MTTLKTEIFNIDGTIVSFETLYAGNQNMVYRINDRFVTNDFWFEFRNEHLPYMLNVIKIS